MSILSYNIIKSNKSKIRTILTIILIKKPKTLSTYWFLILSLHKLSSFVMWVCYHQNPAKFKKEIFFTSPKKEEWSERQKMDQIDGRAISPQACAARSKKLPQKQSASLLGFRPSWRVFVKIITIKT
jgi:hypothetical protein